MSYSRLKAEVKGRGLKVSILGWIKALVNKYDKWCEDLGLTPENKRSCVAYRRDPQGKQTESREDDTANK
ncbi:hypothetical protein BCU97_21295 [Vibrio splendidus]|nr:hypothetical protein BCU97_21295 [Vibrio splendidus]